MPLFCVTSYTTTERIATLVYDVYRLARLQHAPPVDVLRMCIYLLLMNSISMMQYLYNC